MTCIALILYVTALGLFSSSMCNPSRPYIEWLVPFLILSTVLFGVLLHRRLYGKRGRRIHRI